MRKFSLINNDGTSYNLTEKRKSFLYNVDGLGYSRETEFQRIGENLSIVKDNLAQGIISGTIKFWQPGADLQYFQFAQFCQNKPLKLKYVTPTGNTYYRDGYVTSISKSDGNNTPLTVSIEFTSNSPWYKNVNIFNGGDVQGSGKTYNYTYDYTYAEGVQQSVVINSDSYIDSPVRITLYGPLTNPVWSHYLNNNLVSTGKVVGTVNAGNKLVIDTTTIPYSIKQYDMNDNLISDMYQLSDFSTYRFVLLGYGENIISVTNDLIGVIKIGAEARIEYATV